MADNYEELDIKMVLYRNQTLRLAAIIFVFSVVILVLDAVLMVQLGDHSDVPRTVTIVCLVAVRSNNNAGHNQHRTGCY